MSSIFAKRLKMMRLELRQTQQQVADYLEVKRSTYGEYERGKIVPPYDKMEKLANLFNVSVDWLVGKTNFKTYDEKYKVNEEALPDISKDLKLILEDLQNQQKALMFDGKALDDESRELLKSSLENSIKMALLLSKGK